MSVRSSQQAVEQTNNKSNGLIVLSIIAFIFLVGLLVIIIQIRNKDNFVKEEEFEESIDCTDFDPCTIDLKRIIHKRHDRDDHHHREECIEEEDDDDDHDGHHEREHNRHDSDDYDDNNRDHHERDN